MKINPLYLYVEFLENNDLTDEQMVELCEWYRKWSVEYMKEAYQNREDAEENTEEEEVDIMGREWGEYWEHCINALEMYFDEMSTYIQDIKEDQQILRRIG